MTSLFTACLSGETASSLLTAVIVNLIYLVPFNLGGWVGSNYKAQTIISMCLGLYNLAKIVHIKIITASKYLLPPYNKQVVSVEH